MKVEAGSGSPDRKPGSACQSPAGGVSPVGPGGVSPARRASPAAGRDARVFLSMPLPLRVRDLLDGLMKELKAQIRQYNLNSRTQELRVQDAARDERAVALSCR